MKLRFFVSALIMLGALNNQVLAANEEFPGRDIYLGTAHIELADLEKEFDNVLIVDVRSHYEYETLRILGSKNITLNSPSFIRKMSELRDNNKGKKIVVYCNGKTCMKSYKAAQKSKSRGISNVVAFDAGVMDWARNYPAKSVLLGVSPINPAALIPKSKFKERLLDPSKFAAMANDKGVRVLDVRDRLQRSGMSLFVGIENQAPLDNDESLNKYIKQAIDNKKTLLIYDESGKQVRWLMYRLEAKGLSNYYFMKGGTSAYMKQLRNRLR